MTIRGVLDVVASAAVIAACAGVIWKVGASQSPARPTASRAIAIPAQPVETGPWTKGKADATVVLLAFSDFQCPFCRKFATETMPELDRQYFQRGTVQFRFRHMPLERIHPVALKMSYASECAGNQNKFWQMHDALFARPGAVPGAVAPDDGFKEVAGRLHLTIDRFNSCMDSAEVRQRVKRSSAEAEQLQLVSTPTFLIGTLVGSDQIKVSSILQGARPLSEFSEKLDLEISRARSDRPVGSRN